MKKMLKVLVIMLINISGRMYKASRQKNKKFRGFTIRLLILPRSLTGRKAAGKKWNRFWQEFKITIILFKSFKGILTPKTTKEPWQLFNKCMNSSRKELLFKSIQNYGKRTVNCSPLSYRASRTSGKGCRKSRTVSTSWNSKNDYEPFAYLF